MARYNTITSSNSVSGVTTLNSPNSGVLTTFTGSAPYTVTIPSPVLFAGSQQNYYNSTSGVVTLSTPSGVFNGPGTGAANTLALAAGATATILSDGTNYEVLGWLGGPVVGVSATISGALTAQSQVSMNPANQNVSIQPSGSGTVTINPAVAGAIANMSIGQSGTVQAGSFSTLSASGLVTLTSTSASHTISSTTASTGYTSGALSIAGGLGVAGAIFTNSTAKIGGTTTIVGDIDLSGPGATTNITRFPQAAPYGPLTLRFKNGNGANSDGIVLQTASSTAAYTTRFSIGTDTDSPTITMNANSGAVNITAGSGITTTNAKLQLNGYNSNDVIEVNAGSGATSPYMRFKTNGTNNGYLQFTTDTAFFWNDRVNNGIRIQSGNSGLTYYSNTNGTYNTVWHSGNAPTETAQSGASPGGAGSGYSDGSNVVAKTLVGYGIEYFTIMQRLYQINLTSGTTSNFYCLEIQPNAWGSGVATLDIRRTSVHQDGGGFGAFFGRLKYRSTAWGHHQDWWELDENWGNGNMPFIAKAQGNPYATYMYIWLKGGLTYYTNFNTNDYFLQNPVANHLTLSAYDGTFTSLGDKVTTTSIPSNSKYYASDVCSKGYNLGQSSYRWNAIYLSNQPDVSSDRRLKENFGDALGLDFLTALKPCSFTMKDLRIVKDDPHVTWDFSRKQGLIAQEVKEVMDQFGLTSLDFAGYNDENPDHLSLQYEQFIPILIKSVQQQQEQIKSLEDRIKQLESK
jgi:Chaperone of endosialidase